MTEWAFYAVHKARYSPKTVYTRLNLVARQCIPEMKDTTVKKIIC